MAEATATLGFRSAAAPAMEAAEISPIHSSDYDSDVSEGTSALALRRREASDEDDEEEEEEEGDEAGARDGVWEEEEDENEDFADDGKEDTANELDSVNKEGAGAGEEKKEAEPFMVPTTGAFYMHDDRFRDSGGARPRRGMGGRRLWEAKDEKPWVHDMYEELSRGGAEALRRRGRSQGRGRGRGGGRGRGRGRLEDNPQARPQRGYAKGRGAKKDNEENASFNKDDKEQHASHFVPKKQVAASSLSSASPPFFPTGASSSLATENKKAIASGARKLTASSSIFVPKHPQGKTETNEGSNSLFSVQSPSTSRNVPKTDFYPKTRMVAGGASGKGKAVVQAQPTGKIVQHTAQSQHFQEFHSSTPSSRSSPVVNVNESGAAVANAVRNVAGGRGSRSGKGSFMYGGAPARDNSFSPSHPLLQYGNQSQGGVMVPSMVPLSGQPVYGYGNSEIAWVPVLAGGGGGLGTAFMSPYIAMDGASPGMYFAQPSSQPAFQPSGREVGSNSLWRPPPETSDLTSEERQSKPRSSLAKAQSAY